MKATPWFLAAGLAVWLAFALRGEGYAEDEARRLAAVADSLKRVSAKVDTVYARDTVRLWRTVARWDSAKVGTLQALLDSARNMYSVRAETIQVPVEVLAIADSAIQVCRSVVLTCEERVSLRDQRITALEARGRALEAMRPSKWAKLRDGLAWAGAGALAVTVLRR